MKFSAVDCSVEKLSKVIKDTIQVPDKEVTCAPKQNVISSRLVQRGR